MAKIKVKREIDGKSQDLEIEESEILETDVRAEPEPAPGQKPEKTLPQSEVNKIMADERRRHKAEMDALRSEYADFRKGVEDREKAANEAAQKKLEALRADLPDPVLKLLDHLTPVEQLDWLNDPANKLERKSIPPLPDGRGEPGKGPRPQVII